MRLSERGLFMTQHAVDTMDFQVALCRHGLSLRADALETLQINVGRQCNQACRHCHVDAAPWRTETMSRATAERVGEWIRTHRPAIVDLTGGAPELCESFRFLVETARDAGARVMDRCNLTILAEPGFEWLPAYLAEHDVEVVASLPCYLEENVNRQRGDGVFARSIAGLRKLNAVGYGDPLTLSLVYNPLGPTLPPDQGELERDYREHLAREHGVRFSRLFTLTNQPIARFASELRRSGQWDAYLALLEKSFNPATVPGLMCRNTLSVGWQGEVYDCDFNQMLGMQLRNGKPLFLWDVTPGGVRDREIRTGIHCYACTAGCGSSCTGTVA
jgi:radical SAM/Cys-rich protein